MSAYIVNKRHILYLVTAAMSRRIASRYSSKFTWYFGNAKSSELNCGDYERAAEVGNMLWRENIASVSGRYPNESSATLPGPRGESFVIESHDVKPMDFAHDPVQVLKAIQCFEYQSCEHDGWEASEAFAFCRTLRILCIHALPGYDQAEWGAPERNSVANGETV